MEIPFLQMRLKIIMRFVFKKFDFLFFETCSIHKCVLWKYNRLHILFASLVYLHFIFFYVQCALIWLILRQDVAIIMVVATAAVTMTSASWKVSRILTPLRAKREVNTHVYDEFREKFKNYIFYTYEPRYLHDNNMLNEYYQNT